MNVAYGLFGLALACVAWNIVVSMLICAELGRRNVKVNYVFIKALIPWYAHRYKKITIEETGKAGSLFYQWIVSINAAPVTGICAIVAL